MPFMQQSQPPPSTLYQPSQSTPPASAHQQYLVTSSQQSQPPAPGLYQPNQSTPPTTTHQQYFVTSTQQSQLPSPALHQPYQPAPQLPTISQSTQPAQFSTISQSVQLPQLPTPSQSAQPPQLHSPVNPVYYQAHLPLSHQPEEVPYLSSQSIQKSSRPPGGFPPTEQFYVGSTQQIPDHSTSRHYLELPSGYSKPPEQSNPINLFPYNEPCFGSSSSNMKPFQRASSPSFPGSGSSSSQLPTAKILPHALPTASILDSGSASSGNTNSVQVDDVVEKVVAMGFRRDLVRATVRNLTENRQSVDLNVVLDKLMNSR
ncbi:leucine-rich repeat extensin-like protein 2 [Pistacia vera]|nr:leucine-rich repeat extensin-like protein 2 [Pistacia vera]